MTTEKKKPGRPKNGPLVKVGPDVVDKTPQDMIDAEAYSNSLLIQNEHNLAIVNRKFGDELPYDKVRLENECRFFLQASALSILEVGRRLITIKEYEKNQKGSFLNALERIDIDPRSAQKFMKAAMVFGDKPKIANLGRAKMLELITQPVDVLEDFEEGGTIADLKLDDARRLTVRGLNEALNKEKERRAEEAEANQMLLQKKDEKINELDRRLMERTTRVKEWAGVVGEINENISRMSALVKMNLQHLHKQVDQILEEMERFDLSDEESSAIVEPFFIHIQTMYDHLNSLSASFNNNLSGYMPLHDFPHTPLSELVVPTYNDTAD